MKCKVFVNGAAGKMGSEAVTAVEQAEDLQLVGCGYAGEDLATALKNSGTEIVVEFTTPEAVFANSNTIIDCGCHPIIGTTGLNEAQRQHLTARCQQQQLGGLLVPNFSLGAICLMQAAARISRYLPHAEIIEIHHDKKKDSPSGTALKTAALMAEQRTAVAYPSSDEPAAARGSKHHDIAIHSVRLPGHVAHQEVIFGGYYESLTLRHDSLDRRCFMPGVLLACRQVAQLQSLVYGLESLLD